MANKQNFTPEEWSKIVQSVVLSGMAVTAADPSGLIGLLQELFASGSALLKAKTDPGASELIKAVVAEFETSDGRGKVQEAIKARLAGAKAGDVSQRSWRLCVRLRVSSTARLRRTQRRSSNGCARSAAKSPMRRRRAACLDSAARKSAMPRRQRWVKLPRRLALLRRSAVRAAERKLSSRLAMPCQAGSPAGID